MLSSSMDWEILSSRPTLLSHKLQRKMAHFASLDSARVLILCISIFLTKGFDVIKKAAIYE